MRFSIVYTYMVHHDVRFAVRMLTRQPAFLAAAVVTLALGIGANTAIFSVVKAVLLEPLSYRESGRIVAVQTLWTERNRAGSVSGGDYPDLIAEPSPFAAASRYAGGELHVEIDSRAEFVAAYGVDAGFMDVFHVTPVAGRLITPGEFEIKATLALVSAGFAERHFGEPSRALGQVLRVEDRAITIAGVLPAGFHFPVKAELWFPLLWENANRTAHNYRAIALLKPGVTPEAARAHLSGVGARLQQAFPSTHKNKSFTATPLKDLFVERSRMTLWLLMGAVGLVLLVACANVANLLLARAAARSREMALRTALGAGRRRLVRQLLVESALLGLAGGTIGLTLAYVGVDALVRLAPPNLPRVEEIRVDTGALLFNLAVSLGAAVLFGLWPALRAARVDLHDTLKQGGSRAVLGGGGSEWLRGALVSAEVALALVLTLGAGLLFRSFLALNAVDLGYRPEGRLVLTASIQAKTEAQYIQAGATFERIFAALRELPGVRSAAGVMGLPNGPYGSNGLYGVEGMHDLTSGRIDRLPQAGFRLTSPGYFAAMGIPLLAGRDFNERDLYDAEPVVLVSAALVRQVFEGRSPLGRRINCGLDRDVWMRVVGVAGDVRNDNPALPPGPELYMPLRQHPYHANDLHIVVYARGDVSAAAVRSIAQINSTIPVKVSTLEQFHGDAVALPRFRTLLLLVFAVVAAALAAAGVYGVMSYVAAQRQAEMGVRMALGATSGDVLSLLARDGAKMAGRDQRRRVVTAGPRWREDGCGGSGLRTCSCARGGATDRVPVVRHPATRPAHHLLRRSAAGRSGHARRALAGRSSIADRPGVGPAPGVGRRSWQDRLTGGEAFTLPDFYFTTTSNREAGAEK
ncbi:MAG: ABC transporter permease [Acidobacteria bacterium]|nr:ABC transporter permease [Acidobacteriota bacterium]